MEPVFALNAFPNEHLLASLWQAAWGEPLRPGYGQQLRHSLCHGVIWNSRAQTQLIGFVNVAWDGGVHAFLLDTTVHPDFRRQGFATELVRLAVEEARGRGIEWLHVDFEPQLENFYRRCGFRPTAAGLIKF